MLIESKSALLPAVGLLCSVTYIHTFLFVAAIDTDTPKYFSAKQDLVGLCCPPAPPSPHTHTAVRLESRDEDAQNHQEDDNKTKTRASMIWHVAYTHYYILLYYDKRQKSKQQGKTKNKKHTKHPALSRCPSSPAFGRKTVASTHGMSEMGGAENPRTSIKQQAVFCYFKYQSCTSKSSTKKERAGGGKRTHT